MLRNRNALPRLDYLLSFEIAAELESFAAAAKELNVSETAVSRKIRLLEQHYNCALFVRGHRSVKLTDQGRKLLSGVSQPLRSLVQISEVIQGDRRPNMVHMSATNSVSSLWLMPRLRRFHRENAEVTISLLASDQDAECLTDDFDLTILRGDGDWPGFEAQMLFGETIYPVCAPSYLEQVSRIDSPDDLRGHSVVEVDNIHTEWMNWRTWLLQMGADPDQDRHSTFVNTYPLAIQAAIDGLGIALGWGHLVDQHLQSGALVRPLGGAHVRTKSGYYLLRRIGAGRHAEREIVANWLLQESAARERYAHPI